MRDAGARICFLIGGDVGTAILAATPHTAVDLLVGTGGTAENVIAACAVKCMGGAIQGRPAPADEAERVRLRTAGLDPETVLTTDELVRGEDAFFVLTGITDGELVRGVRYESDQATTESLVMRARSGTVRRMESDHRLDRLARYSAVTYRPDANEERQMNVPLHDTARTMVTGGRGILAADESIRTMRFSQQDRFGQQSRRTRA